MTNESKSKDWRDNVNPLGFLPSLLYFSLPAMLFVGGFWILMPWFITSGIWPYYAYLLGLGIPLALLLVAALLWLKLEGRAMTWASMKTRFRLHRMDRKAWLWSLGALLAGSLVGTLLVGQLTGLLIKHSIIPVPTSIPGFMSPISMTDPKTAYNKAVGGLRGNWLPFISMSILLIFNILGEELWWRGVVLPRQELALGQWTWIVHGIMWAFFHIFKWWDVLTLIPICLALSFVCSKLKNTTPGIVIHSVTNGIALLPLLAGILGWI